MFVCWCCGGELAFSDCRLLLFHLIRVVLLSGQKIGVGCRFFECKNYYINKWFLGI